MSSARIKKMFTAMVCVCTLAGSEAATMQFSDDFEGLAVGDLSAVSTNWGPAPWDIQFDVVDDAGDKRVKHSGAANLAVVMVEPSVFSLDFGQDLAITNSFTSEQGNWLHGVAFNYTQTGSTYDMYTAYLTRGGVDNHEIFVHLDKWTDSSSTGGTITNLMSAGTMVNNWALLNSNGTMVVTYDADAQSIGIDIEMESGFSFSTNIVDASPFVSGQAGLFGKLSANYYVDGFSVESLEEPRFIQSAFWDDFEAYPTNDLSAASTNWVDGPWGSSFDVVDDAGDKKAQHDNKNSHCIVLVEPSVFSLPDGEALELESTFSSSSENWKHGIVFNYTQTGNVYDMYVFYLTRGGVNNLEIYANLDKWVGSNDIGSGITNLMSVATGDERSLLDGSGRMVVSYDPGTQEIGMFVKMDSGFTFGTNMVDTSFSAGQVGLYGRAAGDYAVTEFSVESYLVDAPPPLVYIETVPSGLLKLLVDLNGNAPEDFAPALRESMMLGAWTNVPHSSDGVGEFVKTNLTYSTMEGSDHVIYVDASDSAGFFRIQNN